MEPKTEEFVFRKSRPRRRMLHYIAVALHDGAIIATYPRRKPSPKEMKRHGYRVDDDGVLNDATRDGREISDWTDEGRLRFQDILANRLNTRRTVRELVLPVLEQLRQEVTALRAQVAQLSAERGTRGRKASAKG